MISRTALIVSLALIVAQPMAAETEPDPEYVVIKTKLLRQLLQITNALIEKVKDLQATTGCT